MKRAVVFVSTLAVGLGIAGGASAEQVIPGRAVGAREIGEEGWEMPRRESADKLFYARLGQGMSAGMMGGPEVGLGMRMELDRLGIDAGVNLGVTRSGSRMDITGYRGSVQIMTQMFLMPEASRSPYLGAGLSWGKRSEQIGGVAYGGSGLQGELVAGWEFLRDTNMRIFVQGGATVPMYMVGGNVMVPQFRGKPAMVPDMRWMPTVGLSVGIGWGRPRAAMVR